MLTFYLSFTLLIGGYKKYDQIPFFERVDWLEVGQMDISVETEEFYSYQ